MADAMIPDRHTPFLDQDAAEAVADALARTPYAAGCCARTEAAVLLHGPDPAEGTGGLAGHPRYVVRGEAVARRLEELLRSLWGISCRTYVVPAPGTDDGRRGAAVHSPDGVPRPFHRPVSRAYAVEPDPSGPRPPVAELHGPDELPRPLLLARARECCRRAALRAAFLAGGTVVPGVRTAHGMEDRRIEIVCASPAVADTVAALTGAVALRPAEIRPDGPAPLVVLHGLDATRRLLSAAGLAWTPEIQRLLRNTYSSGPTAQDVRDAVARVGGAAPSEVLEAARLRLAAPSVSLTALSRLNGGRPSVRTLTLRLNRLMALAQARSAPAAPPPSPPPASAPASASAPGSGAPG
ncbi:hypothetical protein [Streptomyces celluloflavus]|uniref:hypothetical protein n=1 Tax=Streptomyces celluloflavus TaxID=58344 RepID=UPI0036A9148C